MDPPIDFSELVGDLAEIKAYPEPSQASEFEIESWYVRDVLKRISQGSKNKVYGPGGIRLNIFSSLPAERIVVGAREVYIDEEGHKRVRIPTTVLPEMTSVLYVIGDAGMRILDRYKVGVHSGSYTDLCRRYNTGMADVHLWFAARATITMERAIHKSLKEFRLPLGHIKGRSEVVVMPLPELIRRLKGFVEPKYVLHEAKVRASDHRKPIKDADAREMVRKWIAEYSVRSIIRSPEVKEDKELIYLFHKFDRWLRSRGVFVSLTEFTKRMFCNGCELECPPNDTRKYFRIKK